MACKQRAFLMVMNWRKKRNEQAEMGCGKRSTERWAMWVVVGTRVMCPYFCRPVDYIQPPPTLKKDVLKNNEAFWEHAVPAVCSLFFFSLSCLGFDKHLQTFLSNFVSMPLALAQQSEWESVTLQRPQLKRPAWGYPGLPWGYLLTHIITFRTGVKQAWACTRPRSMPRGRGREGTPAGTRGALKSREPWEPA